MRLFIVNDRVIQDIINSLTIEDNIKNILTNVILRFDYNYINYIYSVFSAYTTYYFSVLEENSGMSQNKLHALTNEFVKHNVQLDIRNLFTADIYDILYCSSCDDKTKFKSYFYDDIYSRLENIFGKETAEEHMEDMFESLETVFCEVEESIMFELIKSGDLNKNITIYVEISNGSLLLYVM